MKASADAVEQRKIRAVAREYERKGYRVVMLRRGGRLPAFLDGIEPDLVAESEQDKVVIEVMRSDAVRGSNDLVEIAERVSREPGWRFELRTIAPLQRASVPSEERMASLEAQAREVARLGFADAAYLFAYAALEELLTDLAVQHGLWVAKMPFMQAVGELVSLGVISAEALETVNHARKRRHRLVHTKEAARPNVAEIERLLAFERHLRNELAAAVAD